MSFWWDFGVLSATSIAYASGGVVGLFIVAFSVMMVLDAWRQGEISWFLLLMLLPGIGPFLYYRAKFHADYPPWTHLWRVFPYTVIVLVLSVVALLLVGAW